MTEGQSTVNHQQDDESVVTRLDIPEVEEGMLPSEYLRRRGHVLQGELEIPKRKGEKDFPRESEYE
jgi:hypothetical protein